MGWFSRKSKSSKAGGTQKECPLGNIKVVVSETGTEKGVSGAKVSISGPKKASSKTNKNGFSEFKKLQPGGYTTKVQLPRKKRDGYKTTAFSPAVTLGSGSTEELQVQVSAQGDLKVNIADEDGKAIVADDVMANGPESLAQQNVNGSHTFKGIAVGKYTVAATLAADKFAPAKPSEQVDVPHGGQGEVNLQVKALNRITPKIDTDTAPLNFWPEPENKEDSGPAAGGPSKEKVAKLNKPKKVEFYAEYSRPERAFPGQGKLVVAGGVVDIFTDEECKSKLELQPDGTALVTNERLKNGVMTTIWVKGKSEGTEKLTLTIDPSADDSNQIGDPAIVSLTVQAGNFVQPKLEVEYLVVPVDRDLAKHRPASENAPAAEAVYIEVSATQTNSKYMFTKGAVLKANPANVEVYADEECKTKVDLNKPIHGRKLLGSTPHKLWLRGATKGKFELSLELEEPADSHVVIDDPAKVAMGAVELEMKVHAQDVAELKKIQIDPDTDPISDYHSALKDKKLPDQKALTDEEKAKTGRLLHEQIDGNHGRAKLLLSKLVAEQWPADTDNYQIYVNRTNYAGEVKLFDAELAGNEVKLPAGPFTVKDLKAAEKILWVEGAKASKGDQGVRLDVTLDREEGGLPKEVKRYADWAYFNIVRIEKVELDYEAPSGEVSAWDKDKKRFFINLKTGDDGRKIKIKAKLTEKRADVVIHFMLIEDKDNRKEANWGKDMPATWKWKDIDKSVKHLDKADRKSLLHVQAKTDANGEARREVTLSRFGGDKFYLSAYIDQDPHLAKFIDGHADLEKRKPVMAKVELGVSRRIWYRVINVEGVNPPSVTPAEGQYKAVKASMENGGDLKISKATASAFTPKAYYEEYMVKKNGRSDKVLVVSESNKGKFFEAYKKDPKLRPIEVPILVCDAQWDGGANSKPMTFPPIKANAFPKNLRQVPTDADALRYNTQVLSPPLQDSSGTLFVQGKWEAADWEADSTGTQDYKGQKGNWVPVGDGDLEAADVDIDSKRRSTNHFRVRLPPAIAGKTKNNTFVLLRNLVVQNARGPYLGEQDPATNQVLAVYQKQDQKHRLDFQDTIVHEYGHALGQTSEADPFGGIKGVPKHPKQSPPGERDQGNHCRHPNATKSRPGECVMYDSGPHDTAKHEFCPVCHPYMLLQDMSKL